jgi:nitric-oxide synthase, bacterial
MDGCPHATRGKDRTVSRLSPRLGYSHSRVKTHADTYLRQYAQECASLRSLQDRLAHIQLQIDHTGTYWQSFDELAYGAKLAWRNSTRCIGRLFWRSLEVRDMRHLSTAEEVFEACVEHLRLATNGGRIRSMITVFGPQPPDQPGIRIWNPQLIRYAGYRQPDGTTLGDPAQVQLTDYLYHLGWQGGEHTAFDVLPLIIQMPGQPPKVFGLPRDAILEVPIRHPDYSWFETLGLKWHALPVISNMCLEIGGVSYTAAPFNGWYMGTEIGARNFADQERYNLLPVIADKLNLRMRSKDSLWKDRALVELNTAVLFSFHSAGVRIVDHHTASSQFVAFEEQERKAKRRVSGDWGWLVPPMSGSTTEVFHRPYENRVLTPNFYSQPSPREIADLQGADELAQAG